MNFKRIFVTCIAIGVLFALCSFLYRYRFGYFVNGPAPNYPYIGADILTLEDGNLLFLGTNYPKDNDPDSTNRPFEIYDIKLNKFYEYNLTDKLVFWSKGLLLKDNKLLLTFVYDPNGKIKYSSYIPGKKKKPPYQYDSMAIIDLRTKKIEKIFQKKINKSYQPDWISTKVTQLNNGKILIIDIYNNAAEIYNPETNTSKLLNIKNLNKYGEITVIPIDSNKALIFGTTLSDKKMKFDTVLQYDDSTESINVVGKMLFREYFMVSKINNNKIIIMGGRIANKSCKEIEIYDTQTNKSNIVAYLSKVNRKLGLHENTFAAAPINDNFYLITGGNIQSEPYAGHRKSTEIIDLVKNKNFKGPDMHKRYSYHKMIKLANNNILIINGNTTQIFKQWKWTTK